MARFPEPGIVDPFINLVELAVYTLTTSILEHILCFTQNVLAGAAERVHVYCRFRTRSALGRRMC